MTVDFGPTAEDYARFRAGFPQPLFQRLAERGVGRRGQRILDLGTGTGSLARGFARRGAWVVALDLSARMLAQAGRLARQEGAEIACLCARAERTGLAAGCFDVVAAGQCWHWFDRAAAIGEARRLLRKGGRLVICHFDWLPLPGNVVEATECLIHAWNPDWTMGGGTGVYPPWYMDLAAAGFVAIESFTFDQTVPYSPEGWRGRIRASAGVAGSLPAAKVRGLDRALAGLLARRFPGPILEVPHRVFALLGRAAGAAGTEPVGATAQPV